MTNIERRNNGIERRNHHKQDVIYNEQGKVPPQCVDIEVIYLGALLSFNTELMRGSLRFLKADDFYKDEHQTIFKACLEILRKGTKLDLVMVASQLKSEGKLGAVGGPYYLTTLGSRVGSDANAEAWAAQIKENSLRRKMINIGMHMVTNSYDETKDTFEVMSESIKNIWSAEPGSDIQWVSGLTIRKTQSDIVDFMDQPFVSGGNVATLIAPPGTGKSNVCDVICAACVNDGIDSLGFKVNLYGKKVLYLDTERSHNDSLKGWERIKTRVGENNWRKMDDIIRLGRLKESAMESRLLSLSNLVSTEEYKLIIIDLVTDFIYDDNDQIETGQLVTALTSLASKYDCGIIVTIHDNPSTAQQKATGVIGSRLMKKSETVIILQREEEDKQVVRLTTDFKFGKARNTGFIGRTTHMSWNPLVNGYSTIKYSATTKELAQVVGVSPANLDMLEITRTIFRNKGGAPMEKAELAQEARSISGKSEVTVLQHIRELLKHGHLQMIGNLIAPNTPNNKTIIGPTQTDEF